MTDTEQLLAALHSLRSFVAVMVGRGPDAIIPDTITSPIGAPIKIGEIMRDADAAIAKAEGHSRSAPTQGGGE